MPEFKSEEEYEKWKEDIKLKAQKKKKGKWGWEWIVLIFMYASIHKGGYDQFHNFNLGKIYLILLFASLFLYYKIRQYLINRKIYGPKSFWTRISAGIYTFIIFYVLFFSLVLFDTYLKRADLVAVSQKYFEKTSKFNEEEKQILNVFIQEPKTIDDFKYNAQKIDEYLKFAERKHDMALEMFKEYRAIHERTGKREKGKVESINKFQLLSDKQYETQKKALELLKKYYLTVDENFLNDYSIMEKEADRLKNEIQNINKDFLLK